MGESSPAVEVIWVSSPSLESNGASMSPQHHRLCDLHVPSACSWMRCKVEDGDRGGLFYVRGIVARAGVMDLGDGGL